MQMKTGILIGLAVVLAFATFFLAKMWLDSQREGYRRAASAATNQKQIQTADILVAKTDLPTGSRIKRENVEWRAWPKNGVVKTHFVKGDKKIDDVLGFIVRNGVLAGEPIVKGRIVEQGDRGYMAALLEPGMQAVAIKITKTSAVAGFIKPGDHVDVLLTLQGGLLGRDRQARQVTETILSDIQVVAVETVTNDQNTKPSVGGTITLQVTPKQAQIFTVSQRVGRMSLVLRSLAREQYIASTEPEPDEGSKDAKGGKTGKDGAAAKTRKNTKTGKGAMVARKGSSDEMNGDEESEDSTEPVGSLRTWDSEVSQVLVQLGGRKKKTDGFEVVRGSRSQRVIIIDETSGKEVGEKGKEVAKTTATGFQAGSRASGTAASTLR